MFNLFKSETQEAMVKMIATQGDLIQTYRESDQEKKELLAKYRQLVDIQEQQINDLKLKLRELREKE